MTTFRSKRIYDEPSADDGYRVLVDRLWPRGVSKERAALDEWDKDVAPTTELREWFGHDPAKFDEFRTRYESELKESPAVAELLKRTKDTSVVTLLYGAKDKQDNQAVVLAAVLSTHQR